MNYSNARSDALCFRQGSGARRCIGVAVCLAVLFLVFPRTARAGGTHGHDASSFSLRLDRAALTLNIAPSGKGNTPTVVLHAAGYDTDAALVDSIFFILLERGAETASSPMAMPPSHEGAPSSHGKTPGLDFGDTEPAAAPTIDLSRYVRLQPMQMAGMYGTPYPLETTGNHRFTLVVTRIGGVSYDTPLVLGGTIAYTLPAATALHRSALMFLVLLFLFAAAAVVVKYRAAQGLAAGARFNLLDIPWLRRFLKSGWFQPVFQIPALLIFLLIMVLGIADVQQGDRNVATILMWTIWWAAIIFTFVLVGRVWCMMCPFGAIQDWLGRIWSLGKTFPRPLRNIWLSTFIFLGLTWWDSWSGIVNNPALTAYLLIGFFAIAGGTALVYRGRTFCRYVCPIGGLIGIYSMFSPLELRNRCLEVCRDDTVKGCIKGTARRYPCPMFVTPMTLDRNNYCNYCSECIKTCAEDNIVLRFRSFARDLWVSSRGYMDEAFLAVALLGVTVVVTAEMIQPWHGWMDGLGNLLPPWVFGGSDHATRERITYSIVFALGSLVLAPGVLLAVSALIHRRTGPESPLSIRKTFAQFAYAFIPVGLAMHLAHNLSHLLNEGPEIVPALKRAANKYLHLGLPPRDWAVTPLLGPETLFWLQMLVLVVFQVFSLYAVYRIALRFYGEKASRAFVPMALLSLVLMFVNVYVLGQPMSARHSH